MGAQGVDDWMPLYWASRHGQVELVQVLLEHGADVAAKDVYVWTPYRRALDEGHVEVVQLLLRNNVAGSSQSKNESDDEDSQDERVMMRGAITLEEMMREREMRRTR